MRSLYPRAVMVVSVDGHAVYHTRTYVVWGPNGTTTDTEFGDMTGSLQAVRNRIADFEANNPGCLVHDYSHHAFAGHRNSR